MSRRANRSFLTVTPALPHAFGALWVLAMLDQAAFSLPAEPGEDFETAFEMRERLTLVRNFGFVLNLLGEMPGFQALTHIPWVVFIAIASRWQLNCESWPTEKTIAAFCRVSVRSVRKALRVLERLGILRTRTVKYSKGTSWNYYSPGLVTLSALVAIKKANPNKGLDEIVKLFRRAEERAAAAALAPPSAPPSSPAQDAAPPPAQDADKPRPTEREKSSFCKLMPESELATQKEQSDVLGREGENAEESKVESAERSTPETAPVVAELPATPPPAMLETQDGITNEDRDAARIVLGERIVRKHPDRKAPVWFDPDLTRSVALCAAAFGGNRDEKLEGLRDAMAGAFKTSKDGAPTVKFIWGTIDHCFDHAARGKRARLAEEKAREKAEKAREARELAKLIPPPPAAPAESMTLEQAQELQRRAFGTVVGDSSAPPVSPTRTIVRVVPIEPELEAEPVPTKASNTPPPCNNGDDEDLAAIRAAIRESLETPAAKLARKVAEGLALHEQWEAEERAKVELNAAPTTEGE